ncbi:hypothetical protein JCM8202v2_003027 [Rhodotorula sphaerocarpa]
MQYEWEKPRQFPASPFAAAASASTADAEPPKKRTHYEAMDVDTPPRPTFPPSATTTADPFHFSDSSNVPPPQASASHPLAFEAGDFHPKEAFGLADEPAIQEISMTADDASELLDSSHDKENLAVTLREDDGQGSKARRGNGEARKRSVRRRRVATDDEASDDASEGDGPARGSGFLDVLRGRAGPRSGDSQFSFQVHHHHAAQAGLSPGPVDAAAMSGRPDEKWMRRSTPYVLLGYVQFGSLALLAILVLSLLLLFLFTLYTDIQARLAELTVELRGEMIQCAKKYVDNFCQERRIPALERKCAEWEECMNREVVVVGKTRVVAETLAEVVNGFVDVISFKTMLFVILTLGLTIYGSSVALAHLPARTPAAPPAGAGSPGLGGPPPHFAHLSPYGAPMYPYGLPYNAGGTPWVIDNGGDGKGAAGGGKESAAREADRVVDRNTS